jgi:hypothetical protein
LFVSIEKCLDKARLNVSERISKDSCVTYWRSFKKYVLKMGRRGVLINDREFHNWEGVLELNT